MSKNVVLKELNLINFKGIKNLTVKFAQLTEICGANATGKSTIFDAFTWVNFGKDSHGNSDTKFGIKTVGPDGKPYEMLDHEVTEVLDVDGETIELRRVFAEDWVKPRGSAETILKGNHTDYFYNGVQVKASEYQAKVDSIMNEQLFKLITNPSYFPSLDWKAQREILLRVANDVTYQDVAQSRSDFAALLAQLSGKDLAEYKVEITYRKKNIQEELDKIPTRIDEITRATPVVTDYVALEAEKAGLIAEIEAIDQAMTNKAESNRQHYAKVQTIQEQINELRTQQQNVVFAAKQAAQKEGYKKNAKHNEAVNQYSATKREFESFIATSNREISDLNSRIREHDTIIENYTKQVEGKRAEWYKRSEEEYVQSTEDFICPVYKTVCGDPRALELEAEGREKAREAFNANKQADLGRITKEGTSLGELLNKVTTSREDLKKQLSERNEATGAKSAEYKNKLEAINAKINATPVVTVSTDIKTEELTEWNMLQGQINELLATITEVPEADNTELNTKKRGLTERLDEAKRKLSLRAVIEANESRKEQLKKESRELAQQKADLEKQEFVADELTKVRMEEVERRVNSKFQNVRFKMFDTQINGGEKPDCIAMVDGVKYNDLNNAAKINAGLDISNTLSLFHEVSAPIFVDNAEGVNDLFPVTSQLVKLVVTTDQELTISQF